MTMNGNDKRPPEDFGENDQEENVEGAETEADVLSNWSGSHEDLFRELYGHRELTEWDNTMIAWYKMGFPISGRGFTLLLDLTEWAWDFFMLFANIILSIHEGNYIDVGATLLLHSVSCVILALFEYSNLIVVPGGIPRFERKPKFLLIKFIFSFLTFWKPIWYYSTYRHNLDRNRLVKAQFQLRKKLTKTEIRCILDIRRDDLGRSHYKLIEVFVKNVPMALLQMYLAFKKNEDFRVCTWEDANRLFMIFSCIYSSAKAATSYTSNYVNYVKPLHFLDYCRSRFRRRINLKVESTVSMIFSFICHLFLNIHRFYAISFFLSINRILAIVFVVSLFISNWILLELVIPLRMTLENPPLGAPTFFSDLIDRWINVFTAHMIRFTSFSSKMYTIKKWRFHFWMGLLQLIPFLVAVSAVAITSIALKSTHGQVYEGRDTLLNNFGENGTIDPRSRCGNWTFESNVKPINSIGNFVFSTHNSFNNYVVTFGDVFGSLNFVALSIYLYIALSLMYSLYLKVFKLNDEQFPVQTAFDFWRTLLKVDWKKPKEAKAFMVLTLLPDLRFQKVLAESRLKCGRSFGGNYWDFLMTQLFAEDPNIEEMTFDEIQQSFSKHQLRYEFEYFRQTCIAVSRTGNETADRDFIRLVSKFYTDFEEQMKNMTSYRIAKTFSLLGRKLEKENGDG